MKLVTYKPRASTPQLGAIVDNKVVSLADASGGALPNDMRAFLELGDEGLKTARRVATKKAAKESGVALGDVKLLAPIPNPNKVIAIGLNYLDHIRETNSKTPSIPIMFTKYTTSIIGDGDTIHWDPKETEKVDWEVELAVVIGKRAYRVSEESAFDYIVGYTVCNDVSARDLQGERGDQWIRGKSLDTFCPLGPALVTKDEIADPHNLGLRTIVNGQTMQDSNTSQLLFKIPHLIAYLSRAFTLLPGDVIITGTPPGVGMGMKPPVWLKDGDVVKVEIDGIGSITNPCVEDK
ncbi:MAG: fumarylacetoacetate hydrolase family protein [Caldilineaceae bacterium]|nr:fumarylacetoacetate hydrolase family protein [Caldilineaceae bacterium]